MSVRAGIVVTGTEVLTGRVVDRNGPWLAEALDDLGVDVAHTIVVGDRAADLRDALRWLTATGVDLIITSGGLGPTEDDLTAAVVAEVQGAEMVLDEALEGRIWMVLQRLRDRWPEVDEAAIRRSNRKQALVPVGATILEPVGTAPGLVVPPAAGARRPTIVVLPGPPGELQAMWRTAMSDGVLAAALTDVTQYRRRTLRVFGIPESEIAETLVQARARGVDLEALEITTCLRRGEVEVVTRHEPSGAVAYDAFAAVVRERHHDTLFSEDGATIDDQVAELLRSSSRTIATAESCTGGLLAGRLTERAGSSDYVLGGLVVYSNAAKVALAGVEPALLDRFGAVSAEVADALADGAVAALGADVGVGITGIAGPGGGTPDKPVGTVCFSVVLRGGTGRITRRELLPGRRSDVRDRSTTVAMHLVRRLLRGEVD